VAVADADGLGDALAAYASTVRAVLVAQLVALLRVANQGVAARDGRVVQSHFGKLAAPDHGVVREAEDLSGKNAGGDDQTRHEGMRAFTAPRVWHKRTCATRRKRKRPDDRRSPGLQALRNSRGGSSRSGVFLCPVITWPAWQPSSRR